ncbi:hypothetical protein BGZ90_002485 [Linnemannia elongata]|nr:hypothetical protein BGZ90_002485 [Linnemannia elongata]
MDETDKTMLQGLSTEETYKKIKEIVAKAMDELKGFTDLTEVASAKMFAVSRGVQTPIGAVSSVSRNAPLAAETASSPGSTYSGREYKTPKPAEPIPVIVTQRRMKSTPSKPPSVDAPNTPADTGLTFNIAGMKGMSRKPAGGAAAQGSSSFTNLPGVPRARSTRALSVSGPAAYSGAQGAANALHTTSVAGDVPSYEVVSDSEDKYLGIMKSIVKLSASTMKDDIVAAILTAREERKTSNTLLCSLLHTIRADIARLGNDKFLENMLVGSPDKTTATYKQLASVDAIADV